MPGDWMSTAKVITSFPSAEGNSSMKARTATDNVILVAPPRHEDDLAKRLGTVKCIVLVRMSLRLIAHRLNLVSCNPIRRCHEVKSG